MGAYLSWITPTGEAKSLFFDVCTSEQQELTSKATEHPVEEGVNVSDHIQRELNRVALEVFVSNTPIHDVNGRGAALQSVPIKLAKYKAPLAATPGAVFGAAGNAIRSLLGAGDPQYAAQVLQFRNTFFAPGDTLAALEALRDEAQLVDVYLTSRVYEGMNIEQVQVTGNAGTGTGRTFRIELKELRKVQVRIVNAPVPTEIRGATKKPKGAQAPKDAPVPDKLRSTAKGAVNMIKDEIKKRAGV